MDKSYQHAQTQNFAPGQDGPVVQTSAKDGEWMTLAKAVEATGLHEKTLRRHIKKKLLRSKRLGSNTNSPLLVYITSESLRAVYAESSVVDDEIDDAEDVELSGGEQGSAGVADKTGVDIENIFKMITQQFAEKLDEQTKLIYDLRNEVIEKEKQILLIPDMQRQAEERAAVEKSALKEKLEQVEAELAKTKAEKEELLSKKRTWWQWFLGTGQ